MHERSLRWVTVLGAAACAGGACIIPPTVFEDDETAAPEVLMVGEGGAPSQSAGTDAASSGAGGACVTDDQCMPKEASEPCLTYRCMAGRCGVELKDDGAIVGDIALGCELVSYCRGGELIRPGDTPCTAVHACSEEIKAPSSFFGKYVQVDGCDGNMACNGQGRCESLASCSSDLPCVSGTCVDGRCVNDLYGKCNLGLGMSCAAGYVCSETDKSKSGICKKGADTECSKNEECESNLCTLQPDQTHRCTGCGPSQLGTYDCPDEQTCVSGTCYVECLEHPEKCNSSAEKCEVFDQLEPIVSACVPEKCNTSEDCRAGERCVLKRFCVSEPVD